jgi:isoleucyl-tRNA synthetase
VADTSLIDKDLEATMDEVLKVITLGRACRNTSNLKNRQPIGKMYVQGPALADFFKEIIEDELNVKDVEFTQDASKFVSYTFKPQLRTVGPKYGKLLGKIRAALGEVNGQEAYAALKNGSPLTFDFDGSIVELAEEDLLIEMAQVPGFVAESDGPVTVALDTNLTPELIEEGFVREIISKIQTMRKDAGFEVTDHITFSYGTNEKIAALAAAHADEIMAETLCDAVQAEAGEGFFVKEWDINGEKATFGVKR